MNDLQISWSNQTGKTAAWTKCLIPSIREWIGRKHGEVAYFLIQMLTGHGCFTAYLKIPSIGRYLLILFANRHSRAYSVSILMEKITEKEIPSENIAGYMLQSQGQYICTTAGHNGD